MNVRRLMGSTLVLASLGACEGDPTAPPDSGPDFDIAASPTRGVTGSGHIAFASGLREFTFHAVQRPDGTVGGSYKIELTSLDLFFTVDVSCLAIEGNTAWVAGHISDTNASFVQVGSVSYFYAIDNGEGAGAPADVVSTARINDVAGEDVLFCTDRPLLLPSFPIEQGNVQIR